MSNDTTKTHYGPWVYDYTTGERIRPATDAEEKISADEAESDGGRGAVILTDDDEIVAPGLEPGRTVYVQ